MLSEATSTSLEHSGHLSELTYLGFRIGTFIHAPNLPSLRDIRVLGCQNVIFPQIQDRESALKNVGSLALIDTSTSLLPSLATFLHQRGLPNLQRLILVGRHPSPVDSLQAVIDELSVGCPKLTCLDLTTDFPVHHDGERLFRLTTLSNLRNLCTNSLYLRSRESQDQLLDSGGLLPPKLTVLQIRGVAYADIGRLMLENSPKGPPALRPFFPGGPSLEKLCFHVKNKNVESERYDTLLASIAKILRARGVEFQVHGNSIATNKLQPLIKLDNPVTQQE
jgi:hypothetical protein